MNVLELVEKVINGQPPTLLKNHCILCVQHILGTTFCMFRSLFKIGLEAKNIFLLGKCYSTNNDISLQMSKEGIEVSKYSTYFDPSVPYDDQYSAYIKKFVLFALNKISERKIKKIIVIDDGGQLIEVLNKVRTSNFKITCIEQTSCGTNLIGKIENSFSVINVAKSYAKKIYESKLIANKVIDNTFQSLKKLNIYPKKIFIFGLGVIGSQIYNFLQKDFFIDGFDICEKKDPNSIQDIKKSLNDYDLIIGSTGQTSLSHDQIKQLKKNTVLVSASSSDREFDIQKIRLSMLDNLNNCHATIFYKGITILNNGFPINFDGSKHSVDPKHIQVTRALLVAAVIQATNIPLNKASLIPLDEKLQGIIISNYKKIVLKDTALTS